MIGKKDRLSYNRNSPFILFKDIYKYFYKSKFFILLFVEKK